MKGIFYYLIVAFFASPYTFANTAGKDLNVYNCNTYDKPIVQPEEPRVIKECTQSSSDDPVIKIQISSLRDLLEQQRYNLNLVISLIGIVIAIAAFSIYRQSGKIEGIYTQYLQKLTGLHENDVQISQHSQAIRNQQKSLEALKAELELDSKIFSAEGTMSKVYQLIASVEKAISTYKEQCATDPLKEDSDLCKSHLAIANDILIEMKDYCNGAISKLQFVQQNLSRLESIARAEMEKKFAAAIVRAYVGSALIHKREWVLTGRTASLHLAIDEINVAISKCDSLTNNLDKARVYYNLACYQCLKGSMNEAKCNLDLATRWNSRYALSSKFDKDLKALFTEGSEVENNSGVT